MSMIMIPRVFVYNFDLDAFVYYQDRPTGTLESESDMVIIKAMTDCELMRLEEL